jgi:phage shock protein A
MKICIDVLDGVPGGNENILNQILQNTITIMALIDDLKAKVTTLETQVTELQASVDAEQTQIAELLATNAQVVTDLNAQIAVLNEQIANGATPEQLQEVSNSLTTISDSINTTKTDLEGTV